MIDLFLGCTFPLPDSKGCFFAKSKTCKTCNMLDKVAPSLSLLYQRQPNTKPVAHLFKLVILTNTITFGPSPICCASVNPHLYHCQINYYYHIKLSYYHIKSGTSITSLPNQNITITSLSYLVAHLVKLIPGGREERLFGLLAEWHKAWKWLVSGFSFTLCILGFSFVLMFWLYVYYISKFHIYLDVLGLIC